MSANKHTDQSILPPPDIETISGQNIPTSLKRALRKHSLLIGSGHITQHSCCSNKTCSTSINARFGLILEVSNDDNDDICLGAGLTATRTIQPGEQIHVSYAGDSSIEDVWEDIFKNKSYCCACRGECMSSEQQLTSRGTHEPVKGTRKPVSKMTALTETRETEDTRDMELEGTPLQQQSPEGHISLHRSDSQNQPQKRAKSHPQGTPNYPSPKERASLVDYQYYVRDTMQDLKTVPSDVHPTIVNNFNIPISRRSFTSMAGGQFLSDDIINWMQTWWRSKIGGGQNNNKNTTPQAHPDLPRCYHANTHWFTKLQEGGATEKFLKWTDKTNLDQDYDLMLIPINTSNHHWYLSVIDFKNKRIVTYDSHEPKATRNTTIPTRSETYSTLMTWLLKRHESIYDSRFLTED